MTRQKMLIQKKIIHFIETETVGHKLEIISLLTQKHYHSGRKVFVSVPSLEAQKYIDQLLWSSPPESFIPHSSSSHERVMIAVSPALPNETEVLINLSPAPHAEAHQFSYIYELEDKTSPQKAQQSQVKRQSYTQLGYNVLIHQGIPD